jgi:hypothetical protein
MRVNVSATLESGSLPMSSAVMESTTSMESRLISAELRKLSRMPVTTTSSTSAAATS